MDGLKWFKFIKLAANFVSCLSSIFCVVFGSLYYNYDSNHYKLYFCLCLVIAAVTLLIGIVLAKCAKRVLCDFLMKKLAQRVKRDGVKNFSVSCAISENPRMTEFFVSISGNITQLVYENYNDYVRECTEEIAQYIKKPVTCVLNFGTWNNIYADY